MLTLKDVILNNTPLSMVLKESGKQHRSYNMYTSMERALGVLLNGEIFLSNGARWNDVNDRYLMDSKNAYGLCLSCSTRENIAMWMLYGAENGKKGAMLKRIGIESRKSIEEMLGIQVNLRLWVKVRPDWRNKTSYMSEYGYKK